MRKQRHFSNEELDRLAQAIVIADACKPEKIDRLVSDPKLYPGVLSRIAAARLTESKRLFVSLAWKPLFASFIGVVALSVVGIGLLSDAGTETAESIERMVPQPYTVIKDERPFRLDETDVERPALTSPAAAQASIRPSEPRRRPNANTKAIAQPLPEAAFYPIGPASGADDAVIDGRVVRVELPRAALFALGADVPLENGARPVKADLLVGADGVPRAIRLVE